MARLSHAHNQRNVTILTGVGHFTTHFFELMFPTLAVTLVLDTGIELEQVLGWSFLGYLLFGLGALPAGLVADRVGARQMLIIGMGGMGVSALAAGEVRTGTPLVLCLASLGAFASIYHPVGMSLISRTMSARGRALGLNGIFGNLAIATTPIITASLCASIGWRATYVLTGLAMCAVTVTCAFLRIDERPRAGPVATPAPPATANGGSMLLFAVLLATATLAGISYRGNTLVQPAYFAERVSLLGFGATTSLVYLFGIGGQYFGGIVADRYDLRWLYLGFHAVTLPALLAMTRLTELPLVGSAAIFVVFSLGMQPIENSLFARVTPARWRATAFGAKFVLVFGVGSTAVWLVEWAEAAGGLQFVLLCLAGVVGLILLAAGLFVALSLGRPLHNAPAEHEAWALAGAPLAVETVVSRSENGRPKRHFSSPALLAGEDRDEGPD